MCGCDFPIGTICGYHRDAILRELLAIKAAEDDGRGGDVRIRRQEIVALYGRMRVAMVQADLDEGGEEFARVGRVAQGSVFG